MRVVVTGASGSVGTALRRELRDDDHPHPDRTHDVLGVARRVPDDSRWVRCDIGAPGAEEILTRAFDGADAVVHLAWAIQPRTDEPDMRRTNIGGTEHVLRAADRAGVPHLVVASSVAAYSPADHPVDEDWPRDGVAGSGYSLHKAELERMVAGRSSTTVVRPAAVVQDDAAGEIERWTLSPLVPAALLGRSWLPVPLWRGLRLQVVHARDVAGAVALLLRGRTTGAFNVAADPALRARDLAEIFGGFLVPVPFAAAHAVAGPAWRFGAQPLHPGWLRLADQVSLVDTTRLRALGWAPRYAPREVLDSLVRAMIDGRGTWGPLAPRDGAWWRRLGWGRPSRQGGLR
ncbi:NAD-dependent epimerase/dehydratase family protein [Saccharothrix longispora]|uniref:Nucleoside-diphosphate-sugar epimerase n=1 Tax=Saccharothrix longispora TaxID=33920 RepID=A0ABU1PN27_9PSEU|nr:NAD-dependent epimerase/dehydratase family protein [Saccharothrix longispora]MDR6592077.1 nucleoside-diphosphate-sugar epimerase [Saccharothrix longispora]